jgi:hypothetical protein
VVDGERDADAEPSPVIPEQMNHAATNLSEIGRSKRLYIIRFLLPVRMIGAENDTYEKNNAADLHQGILHKLHGLSIRWVSNQLTSAS